jgi:hypothetical protein
MLTVQTNQSGEETRTADSPERKRKNTLLGEMTQALYAHMNNKTIKKRTHYITV